MLVTLDEISARFDVLISGAQSRESIADFASAAMEADDAGSLTMQPDSDALKIWEAIKYLSGVDLQTSPSVYLHSVEDFEEYRLRNGI